MRQDAGQALRAGVNGNTVDQVSTSAIISLQFNMASISLIRRQDLSAHDNDHTADRAKLA
jgi:hypothetical protein